MYIYIYIHIFSYIFVNIYMCISIYKVISAPKPAPTAGNLLNTRSGATGWIGKMGAPGLSGYSRTRPYTRTYRWEYVEY